MRALQRIASACLCLPLAVALVPAAAFAAPADEPSQVAGSGIHLHTQSTCPGGDHKWVWYTQPGSDYLMNGVCMVCETPITNKVSVPISGNRTSGEIQQLIENNVSKFKEDNAGVGINDVDPAVVLELRGDTVIDVDADMSAVSIEQNVPFSGGKYNLTIKGNGEGKLRITNDGIRIGGTFTMEEKGKAHVRATSGTALYAAKGIVLSGGELAVEGNLYGMLSGGDITMKDPARLDAQAGFANSSFAAISSFGSIVVDSGVIERARGAHGIYSKGDITISGGEVNASVNTDGNSEPAVFAVGSLKIDPDVMEYVIPRGATTGLGTLNSGISAQAESGATVTDNGLNAPVVRVVDNITRDAAFYEKFYSQGTSDGNGGNGGAGDGNGNGTGIGTGNGNGNGTSNGDGNGNGSGNGAGNGNGTDNGNGTGDGSGSGSGNGNGNGAGNGSGTGNGDGAGSGSENGDGNGTGGNGAGNGNGTSGSETGTDGSGGAGTGSNDGANGSSGANGANGTNDANGTNGADGTNGSGSGSSGNSSSSANSSALAASAAGEGDASGATFRTLRLYAKTVKKNSIKLKWRKVSGAKRYVVLGTKCGSSNRYQIIDNITSTSYTDSGLKKNTYYRYYIVAFDAQNRILAKSKTIHAATKGGKYTNAKKVSVGRKSVTMRKGTTFSMNASFTKVSNKAKLKQHVKMRYESSDKSVATVTKKGKVTAKGKVGSTCTIYAYAQNGLYATTKVTIV